LLVDPAFGARAASLLAHGGVRYLLASLHHDLQAARSGGEKRAAGGSVAVIPIHDAISNRPHSFGTSTQEIGAAFDVAVASNDVASILLDIDSPGGTVEGVPELAERVFAARDVKPVVAIANGMMASAAYWIGAAAGEVVVTPSSVVGSIGVYTIHVDITKWLEQEGEKVTTMSFGKYKTELAPWIEITEEAQAFLQQQVDEIGVWFVRDVARFRGDTAANVQGGYGEGRVLSAGAALQAGLVNRIATFEETLDRMLAEAKPQKRGMRTESLRRQLDLAG
jgi:signal peptide peptidase SppA